MFCCCHTQCRCCHKQSFFGRFVDALAEALNEEHRRHLRAKDAKRDALAKYKGTRVVTIALRAYTNFWGGKNKKSFWYAHEDTRGSVLAFAEREWKKDPNSWGPLCWLVGLAQRLSTPLRWSAKGLHRLFYFLDERKMIPREWNSMDAQCRRYAFISKMERNWNQTPFSPGSN